MNTRTSLLLDGELRLPRLRRAAARAVASGEYDRASSSAPPASASPLPPTRCRCTAAPTGCADSLEAEMTRRHNDANMLAIGAGFTGKNLAERMVVFSPRTLRVAGMSGA